MEDNTTQKNISEKSEIDAIEKKVFDKIHSGEVRMRSKTFFVLKIVVLILVAILVLSTSALLVSFMLFSLRVSGRLFLLGFGGRGFLAFFITFPWFILLVDILFIVLFERLLNHFKFGYRTPLLYTLGASALIIILAGFVLDHISIHETLAQEAAEHHLGPVGGLYTDVRLPPREEGVFRGVVTGISTNVPVMPPGWPADVVGVSSSTGSSTSAPPFINAFTMRRDDEDADTDDATDTVTIWRVILPPGVSIAGFLEPGDVVLVAGDVGSDTIHAYGIKKIEVGDEQ